MSDFTQGPWLADVDYVHGPIVVAPNGDIVADYTCWDGHREEAKANARLIAAAPDLLAALIAARDFGLDDFQSGEQPIYQQMDAAIAKALGQ